VSARSYPLTSPSDRCYNWVEGYTSGLFRHTTSYGRQTGAAVSVSAFLFAGRASAVSLAPFRLPAKSTHQVISEGRWQRVKSIAVQELAGYVTIQGAAIHLGRSYWETYGLIRRNRIPAIRVGKTLMVRLSDLSDLKQR
jgi:hypothetical protein